jgi:hypothetical protein
MTVEPNFWRVLFTTILLVAVPLALVIGACVAALALAALIGGA